jgi:hypothetical protein
VIIIVVAARILYLVESNETSIKIEATRKEVTTDQNNEDTISVISTSTGAFFLFVVSLLIKQIQITNKIFRFQQFITFGRFHADHT